jgi:predicted phosphodiesterase
LIYVTGDMHGDLTRFKSKPMRALRKNDVLIVCGDFGFVWDDSPKEKRILKWIGKRKYHVLFVEGPNDNLELLRRYPQAEWNGGKVREISGRLRQLMRGEIYSIEGKVIFAFGGGSRKEESDLLPPWAQWELPSPEELEHARQNLAKWDNKVDYIITHQPSRKIMEFLHPHHHDVNVLDAFLDELRKTCTYRRWYFGFLHKNKQIPPAEVALFQDVVRAN